MIELLQTFGMREWLISVGLFLVLGVLIDGFRRMRKDKKNNIKMSRNLNKSFLDDDDHMPELPSGGARVINRSNPIIHEQVEDDLFVNSLDSNDDDYQEILKPDPEDIIVIHVKSKSEEGFIGSDLLQILLACELRFGEKDIFHSYENSNDPRTLQFSLANMIEPGTFDLDNINSFRTPGVTFFMTLPSNSDPVDSFDRMIETASTLVENLSAKMFDEEHKPMNKTKLSKYESRVAIFKEKDAN